MTTLAGRALVSGATGCLASVAALALVALVEGKAVAQPLNATSHWRHGDGSARFRGIDAARTGTGLATHFAATCFWAAFFEAWEGRRRRLGRAAAVSALAATVDYTITPHRFTPGWELVLSRAGMALVYSAMAAGLAAAPT